MALSRHDVALKTVWQNPVRREEFDGYPTVAVVENLNQLTDWLAELRQKIWR